MRIGIVQSNPCFGKVERNLHRVEELVGEGRADLWVIPELFATGYQFVSREDLERLAEPIPNGKTTQALIDIAQARRCHIVAGIPEIAGETLYNTAVIVGPSGFLERYRKIHLFFEEKRWFTPGDGPFPVIDIGIAKVGLMIWLALRGAEIIAHPANLVMPIYAQLTMRVRALENGLFTATANRVGIEARSAQTLHFTGESQIISPRGEILARLSPDQEETKIVEIDPVKARDKTLNQYNDLIADRRPRLYIESLSD
jgi:predicted amidohydrolase